MKILLFFIISLMSGALSFAQHIKLININSDLYPYIKITIEIPQNFQKEQIQVYASEKKIDFKLVPIKKENPSYLFYIIDYNSFGKNEQNFIFDALINSLENIEKENLYINIGLAQSNHIYKCFSPLSYAYTSDIKDFILYSKQNTINYGKVINPECLIKEGIDFLKQTDISKNSHQTIIFICNNIKNYAQANSILKVANETSGIHLKIVAPIVDTLNIKPNNFYSVSGTKDLHAWQKALLQASEEDDLTNLSANKQYLIEFKLNEHLPSGIIKIQYNNELLKLKITKPEKQYFFKEHFYLIIVGILGIIILMLLRRIYLLKKHIRNLKETISMLFDKKMKILSKQTENPVLEIKLEDSFKNYHIKKPSTTIGRGKECDIKIKDMTVSTLHATITNEGGEFYIQDNESTNGVFVNDIKIEKKNIKPGDIIRLGKAILTLHY
ncbi:MAG: FHA domain-containing protein [Bacteroidales bacterium]|nr:FHA domain-containing protein [Bacteroidales bacterium]